MASALKWTVATLALCVLASSVTCLTCPEAQQQAAEWCGGRMGCFQPRCLSDEFAAIQCLGSGCFCVSTDGTPIKEYSWQYADYSTSDCQCARDELAGESVSCESDGSYETVVVS